ncbi:SDR family NAD(P)-dependent oxidoreductase [Streptomyces longisporoflavus]|uniref:SDR family NAD(P)-dependent oxidoreductase n=1 Tax=Streptomyces longisporoflavus TaxID=28044 RepID=A0ABW7R7V5_9ACTN
MFTEPSGGELQVDRIAVVGMSCWAPNAADPTAFWHLVSTEPRPAPAGSGEGEDAGGADAFDAEFFGLSASEAEGLDPRRRLLLELAWEALEDAAIVPASLRGTPAGVFVGAPGGAGDAGGAGVDQDAGAAPDTGAAAPDTSAVPDTSAARIARSLGLSGPSPTIAPGPSSSSAALLRACESLRGGEITTALVAGPLVHPSPDGRTPDALGGRGAAVVVLKPLNLALADGDRVHGVIADSVASTGRVASQGSVASESSVASEDEGDGRGPAVDITGLLKALLSMRHRGSGESPRGETAGIVEAAPALDQAEPLDRARSAGGSAPAVVPWPLSGRTPSDLRRQAASLLAGVEDDRAGRPQDIGWSLASGRTAFAHRAVAVGSSREELLASLREVADGHTFAGPVTDPDRTRTVFVFPDASDGTDSSRLAQSAAELWQASPVFAARMAECADAVAEFADWSLTEVILGAGSRGAAGLPSTDSDSDSDSPEVARAVRFAHTVALAEVWRSYGVVPHRIVAETGGAVAAACVAGSLSLRDAVRAVTSASRLPVHLSPDDGSIPCHLVSGDGLQDAVRAVLDNGSTVFVEVSHHPALAGELMRAAADMDRSCAVIGSLRNDEPALRRLTTSLAEAYVKGVAVDWRHAFDGSDARRVDLPVYAFARRWREERTPRRRPEPPVQQEGTGAQADSRDSRDSKELVRLVLATATAVLDDEQLGLAEKNLSFKDLGFDSQSALAVTHQLAEATGLQLPATLLFDHPTPEAVAGYLEDLRNGVTRKPSAAPAKAGPASPRRTRQDEPIAIIGMACRYPGGVTSPEDLWQLVAEGRDVISPFPTNRGWSEDLYDPDPASSGRSYTRSGGFLHDVGDFDAAFFGISPRDALAMDPQQRLMLETSWEAIERAKLDPRTLHGTPTGVFIGAMAPDYGPRMHEATQDIEGHVLTGSTASIISGRISYQLGLTGPALTIDTACSSSLVALHTAMRSLRTQESGLALAGGVTVMATPGMFVEFSRQRGLAADGRCKSFAAAADGTGWAEGAGVLLLERLSDAQRLGHEVLGVLRGSAVNQDGASNGLTAPNGPSQERVIRDALADAGLNPGDIDLVEAHGTGTRLGDPIEAQALQATYGHHHHRKSGQPLYLGSLKSNIGHSQAAAGVGGVIKMVQAMRHRTMPRTLHVDQPTPHIDWDSAAMELLVEPRPWPHTHDRPARAAVSSFGISGTNAHVILEEAKSVPRGAAAPKAGMPEPDTAAAVRAGGPDTPLVPLPLPWALSARSADGLRAQARRLLDLAARPGLSPADIGYSLATTRSTFEHRAVVLGRSTADLVQRLETLAAGTSGTSHPEVITGHAPGPVSTAFVFSGQGAQRLGMGRELAAAIPEFASALDDVCKHLDQLLDRPLRVVMFAAESDTEGAADAPLIDRTEYTQPALFAIEVALFRLLEGWGVRPDYVAGHSIGEIAAAHVAGVMSLQDAAQLVVSRGRLMGAARNDGTMVAVGAAEKDIIDDLNGTTGVDIAAVNGPEATVVSGDTQTLDTLTERWRERGLRTSRLRVSHAFHSSHMDSALDEFRQVAAGLDFNEPTIPLVSTVTGTLAAPGELTSPDYWVRQLRGTVRFHDAVRTLEDEGVGLCLEVGPDAVLTGMIRNGQGDGEGEGARAITAVPLLRARHSETAALSAGVARAHVHGAHVDLAAFFPGAAHVDLPTYAFRHSRYWLTSVRRADRPDAASHPLLDTVVELAGRDETVLSGCVSPDDHPWLIDHTIDGNVILPATAFLELAATAAARTGAAGVEQLTLEAPLRLLKGESVRLQIIVQAPDQDAVRAFSVHAQPVDADGGDGGDTVAWSRYASGSLAPAGATAPEPAAFEPLRNWPPQHATEIPLDGVYARLAELGYEYGPAFQGLRGIWQHGEELYAEVQLPGQLHDAADEFAVHPALLDAAIQPLVVSASEELAAGDLLRLPFDWQSAAFWNPDGLTALRVRLTPSGSDSTAIAIADQHGSPVAEARALTMRPVPRQQFTGQFGAGPSAPHAVEWQPVTAPDLGEAPEKLVYITDRLPEDIGTTVLQVPPHNTDSDVAGGVRGVVGEVLKWVQAWLGDARFEDSRLIVVTRGAVGPVQDAGAVDLASASVWGLLRSAQSEHPGRIVLADVEESPAGSDELAGLLRAVAGSGLAQVAVREGQLLAPRMVRTSATGTGPDWGDGTVLVTGATGTLGAIAARHLVRERGVRDLLLLSRSGGAAPNAPELRAELEELGARVTIAACDVADRDALADVLARIPADHPLTGVVHTAGIAEDGVLSEMSQEQLERVLRPKVDGAWNLHELTRDHALKAFVLYSSLAGLFGTAGQANYAAGNAFLDGLATMRRAQGLPAVSMAWGLWQEASGISGELSEVDLRRLNRMGLQALSSSEAMGLFDAALAADEPVLALTGIDTRALRARTEDVPELLQALVPTTRRARAAAESQTSSAQPQSQSAQSQSQSQPQSLGARLAGLPPEERERSTIDLVRGVVADILGHDDPNEVEVERAFQELGFDSLNAVELRNRLNKLSGLQLTNTVVFDYPSVDALARFLAGQLADRHAPAPSTLPAAPAAGGPVSPLLQRLAGLQADERKRAIVELVQEEVADILGHDDPREIEADRAFQELGFDSLSAVELRNRLNKASGVRFTNTVVFDYPSVGALAGFLDEQLTDQIDQLTRVTHGETAPDTVLSHLGELEERIRGVGDDDALRRQITEQLQRLLELTGAGLDEDLDAASDEELFALVDRAE